MGVERTSLVAMSTPRDDTNYFSIIVNAKIPGTLTPVFNVLRLGLPCDDCITAGKPWTCPHNRADDAPWKSRAKNTKWDFFLERFGKEDTIMNEQCGMITASGDRIFQPDDIAKLFTTQHVALSKRPSYVFLTIDPAGGGASEHSLTGTVFEINSSGYRIIVVFHAAKRLVPMSLRTQESILHDCIANIRTQPGLEDIPILIAAEVEPGSNCSNAAAFLLGHNTQQPPVHNVYIMREAGSDPVGRNDGVPKRPYSAFTMSCMINEALSRGELLFWEHFSTLYDTPSGCLNALRKQLEAYSWVRDARSQSTKINGKSQGENDDRVITLIMAPFWHDVFVRKAASGIDPEYTQFAAQCINARDYWR